MSAAVRLTRLLVPRTPTTRLATPHIVVKRNLSGFRKVSQTNYNYLWIIGGGVTAFVCANMLKTHYTPVHALRIMRAAQEEASVKLTARERRFVKFASVEFEGQLYMTPQDFLDSAVEQEPRPRLKRRILTMQDINDFKDTTPPLKKGSKNMFRNMRDRGIISYTEYLFLLSVLTKPTSGFRIAFNMFDTDGNARVDKNEFLVLLKILGATFKGVQVDENTRRVLLTLVSNQEQAKYLMRKPNAPVEEKKESYMETIFSGAWREKRARHRKTTGDEKEKENDQAELTEDDKGLQRRHSVDTTLLTHFFGKKGNQTLNYDGYHKFMDNLQTEVLELEFSEFSKGKPAITELDFAKILLRYTYLNTDDYDKFLERLLDREKNDRGITFDEFRDFCRFLNNLEDFAIAMSMYTLADRAISKDEFSRAVKICTGYSLTKHIINTVFAIFDQDGDGLLSYKEFIAIMKDRLHRGSRSAGKSEGWEAFKHCIKQDLNQSQRQ